MQRARMVAAAMLPLVGLAVLSSLQPAQAALGRTLQGPGPKTVKRQVTANGGLKLYSDDNPCSKTRVLSIPRCAAVDYLAIAGQKKCADGSCRIYVSYKGEWGYIASGKPKPGMPCGSAGGIAYVATFPANACKPKPKRSPPKPKRSPPKPRRSPPKPTPSPPHTGLQCDICSGRLKMDPQEWRCGTQCVTKAELADRLDCNGVSAQKGCSAGRVCCVPRRLSGSGP